MPIIGVIAIYKKIKGAIYYTIGQGGFAISMIYQSNSKFLLGSTDVYAIYATVIGSIFDIIFLSLALTVQIKTLRIEKEKLTNILIAQSNIVSVSKIVSNISHQWKNPIIHLSTLITYIEALFYTKKPNIEKEIKSSLQKMKNSLVFMQDTIAEFNNIYNLNSDKVLFYPSKEIELIINILTFKQYETNTKIHLDIDTTINFIGYKNAFANICMVIIDNALDNFKTKSKLNPIIDISLKQYHQSIILNISDNGGGIEIKPIENIFELYHSNKGANHGLGLYIAKILIIEKFNGRIDVRNSNDGAIFRIEFNENLE
jgi:signal transduction histidine kinase